MRGQESSSSRDAATCSLSTGSLWAKNGRIWLACVVGGHPIEIAFAVRGETEAFTPALGAQVDCVFLAFEIEREECFDPFRGILRLQRIFGVGSGSANLDLFSEDGGVVFVEREKALRKVSSDTLLDLVGIGMNEPAAERLARGLQLLWRLAIAVLMDEPARADDSHEQHEGDNQRT